MTENFLLLFICFSPKKRGKKLPFTLVVELKSLLPNGPGTMATIFMPRGNFHRLHQSDAFGK